MARRCWRPSSGPTCSWCRWTRSAAGGATTSCSPTCSAPACSSSGPSGSRRCTAPRPPGRRRMGWPTTPCATRWPPGMPPGRRGWSSGTSTRCSCAARRRPCSGGLRRCRQSWPAPAHGCCWRRRCWPPSVGRAASLVANVPAMIALYRAYVAALRGDADRAITLGQRALAQLGEGEGMLDSTIRGYLAMAEWLRGRLAEAERAFASIIAQWRGAGERFVAVRVCELLGLVQRAQGRLDAALGTYQQALEIAAGPGLPAAGIAQVGMAEVAYQRDELDAALEHVSE